MPRTGFEIKEMDRYGVRNISSFGIQCTAGDSVFQATAESGFSGS